MWLWRANSQLFRPLRAIGPQRHSLPKTPGKKTGGESPVSRKSLLIALGAVVLIAAAAIGYYVMNGSGSTATAAGSGYEILPADKT